MGSTPVTRSSLAPRCGVAAWDEPRTPRRISGIAFRAAAGVLATALTAAAVPATARAAERVTLRTGFTVTCERREALDAERTRLYLDPASTQFMDVATANIQTVEASSVPAIPATRQLSPMASITAQTRAPAAASATTQSSATAPIDALIRRAGESRRINVDLLRSVVNAESGGHVRAVSRAGAQGLMQLMPGTARTLGVTDSFAPEQNLRGGTDYLDTLLRRYNDDLSLALAAYNAGPGAVDRYRGIPPFRETRLYVARIIHEFNRRTLLAQRSAGQGSASQADGAVEAR